MKTQIVQLQGHDDVISIRDKLAWAKAPRILLAWPRRGQVDVRPLDLVLLRRNAATLGTELGLVTRDREIRAAAHRLGIPVFKTSSEAQHTDWPVAESLALRRRRPRLDLRALRAALPPAELLPFTELPEARFALFAAAVLSVLAIMLVFVPSADVKLDPPLQTQSLVLPVSAEPDVTHVNVSGTLPARSVSVTLELSGTVPVTGQIDAAGDRARGTVEFSNLTNAAVSVPAGTILLTGGTPPVEFATTEAAKVSAGARQAANVGVLAVLGGAGGNVDAGAITSFQSPLGLQLSVTNPAATSGGADRVNAAPSAQDRKDLRASLMSKLEDQARVQLPGKLTSGDIFFPSTLQTDKVLEETYTPPSGQPGKELTLLLRVQFSASYAAAQDLQELANLALDASLPADEVPQPGSLQLTSDSSLFSGPNGVTRWRMKAERQVHAQVSPFQVIGLVQGQTSGAAAQRLTQAYSLQDAPQIAIRPFWWPWLPYLPFRITVTG